MIPVNKREIGVCILLSFLTFGIWEIYWRYLLVKNTRALKKDTSRVTGEMLCLILVPFYSLYWWYTRGKLVKEKFAEQGVNAAGAGSSISSSAFWASRSYPWPSCSTISTSCRLRPLIRCRCARA